MEFQDATIQEVDEVMQKAWKAFNAYGKLSTKQRAGFMRAIAKELDAAGEELIHITMQETNLPEARLR
ncbi:MAG: aldehyde dehydrogenase family protein, partial [Chitinophagaceae bacterium]